MDNKAKDEAALCARLLSEGKIILYLTDTIWGIGCDATNEEAVQKIYHLKQRINSKAMIALLSPEINLKEYVPEPAPELLAYLKTTTTPTTAIYNHAINLAGGIISEDGSVAIRITTDAFCCAMINQLNKPIVSTSANVSGMPSPRNFSEINDEIKNGVDFSVQHRRNDFREAGASRIIRLSEDKKIVVVR